MTRSVALLTVPMAVLVSACATAVQRPPLPGVPPAGTELRREQLGAALNLLDGLAGRVRNLQIDSTVSDCPLIILRGARSLNRMDPVIYVNGARMADTCILREIRVREVEYVRIIPGAAGGSAAGAARAGGLILIQLR
jgi:hypothetical protein